MTPVEIDARSVRGLAGARSFERGKAYLAAGHVRRLGVDGTSVTATVDGTRAYRVQLEIKLKGLEGSCSCPQGHEGAFCKHCVAVGLAWLDRGGEVGEPRAQPVTDVRLRAFLLAQDRTWLAEQLPGAARADPLLRARLDVAAGADERVAYDDRALRKRLERAIEIGDFVEYGAAYSYFAGVGEVLDAVAELVDAGFPDGAAKLAEYALELLDASAGLVDDSDGGLREAIDRAEEIHLAACAEGSPDPVALAEMLVGKALASDLEVFLDVLPDYEPVLGSTGIARYRELVEQSWQRLPPKRRGDYGSGRFVVTHLMERVAESVGGTDALVEVLARDVSSGYDVLRIAERLHADGRDDEALGWLARGMADFPPDGRLRTLAAACHLRGGRRREAGELLWENFAGRPGLDTYVALHDATAEQFPDWRDRAIAALLTEPATTARFTHTPFRPAGRSVLVEVLLWEGDADAAWQAALDGGCADHLWLRLARQRAAAHPSDAIPILLAAADQAIGHKKRDSYQVAAGLLTEAGVASARCDRSEEFASHLASLRSRHRPKRALREELDRARLP